EPPVTFDVFSMTGTTGTFGLVAGISLTLPGNGGTSDFVLIAFSRPVPAGRSFWSTFTQQQVTTGDATTVTLSTPAYGALFGTPVLGQKVFVKLTPVNQYGVTGVPVVFPLSVAA